MVPVLQSEVYANLWEGNGLRLWTVINNSKEIKNGGLVLMDGRSGERYFELISGKEIEGIGVNGKITLSCTMNPKGIAAFLAIPVGKADDDFKQFLAGQVTTKANENLSPEFIPLPVVLKPVLHTKKY